MQDPDLVQIMMYLKYGNKYTSKVPYELSQKNTHKYFLTKDDVLYRKAEERLPFDHPSLLVIPRSLRKQILEEAHDSAVGGHLGEQRTYSKLKVRYFWPNMYSQTLDWVKTCEDCNLRKRHYGGKKASLIPLEVSLPFERVSLDLVGKLPTTKEGNKWLLTIIDHRTRWPIAIPLKSADAKTVAKAFFDHVCTVFSIPRAILTDRGRNFCSSLFRELCALMKIKRLMTTAYHPATNGVLERIHGPLVKALSMYTNNKQDNWDTLVQGACLALRCSSHAGTGLSPFVLLFGFRARLTTDVNLLPASTLSLADSEMRAYMAKNLAIARDLSAKNEEIYKKKMKERYDISTKTPNYEVGQQVYLHDSVKPKGRSKKLSTHFKGPYTITERLGAVNYRLEGLSKETHPIVHVNRLKPLRVRREDSLRTMKDTDEEITGQNIDPKDQGGDYSEITVEIPEPLETVTLRKKRRVRLPEQSEIENSSTLSKDKEEDKDEGGDAGEILRHRRKYNNVEYLHKESNLPPSAAVWKTPQQLKNPVLVSQYLSSRIDRPNTRDKSTRPAVCNINPTVCNTDSTEDNRPEPPETTTNHWQSLRRGFSVREAIVCLLITLLWVNANWKMGEACQSPDLGPLSNCDLSTYEGIYTYPEKRHCPKMSEYLNMSHFQGWVEQYHPQTSYVTIHHCMAKRYRLSCKETGFDGFLGHKTYRHREKTLMVDSQSCRRAVRTKISPYGNLYNVNNSTMSTQHRHLYKCTWLDQTIRIYDEFIVKSYIGSITGDQEQVAQTVTVSTCKYKSFSCKPKELPNSVIIWEKVKHRFTPYRNLGRFHIKLLNEFILVPALGIGGSIVTKTRYTLYLDAGYRIRNTTKHATGRLITVADKMFAGERLSAREDVSEGRFINQMLKTTDILMQLQHSLCKENQRFQSLQTWIMKSFPETSHDFLFSEEGKFAEQIGDAILVHKCQQILHYDVIWNQTIGGKCYADYPVILNDTRELQFLQLPGRRLNSKSPKVGCPTRQKMTFIRDKHEHLWLLDTQNRFTRVKEKRHRKHFLHINIPALAEFSSKLQHYDKKPLRQASLLQLLSQNAETMEDFADIKEKGAGDFVAGFGKILGNTVSSVAAGGNVIISSIGKSLHDVLNGVSNLDSSLINSIGNASSNVISSGTSGFAKILQSFTGDLTLWILVLLLYALFIGQYVPGLPRILRIPGHSENFNLRRTGNVSLKETKGEMEMTIKEERTRKERNKDKTPKVRDRSPQESSRWSDRYKDYNNSGRIERKKRQRIRIQEGDSV